MSKKNCRCKISTFIFCFFFIICMSGCVSSNVELVKIQPTEGVNQEFILITPEHPVASLILFAGGSGTLELVSGSSMRKLSGNFLVRSRYHFVRKGFQVAVIDAPYDKFGYMPLNRGSDEHRSHVRAVADYLKSIVDVPVWLVGTSRGTESVANIAVNDPEPYAGVVFTSTTQDALYGNLDKITLPALIVHHRQDGCFVCSPDVAQSLYDRLLNARSRKLVWVDGGISKGNPCQARASHGFNGIEYKVVNAVSEFILDAAK